MAFESGMYKFELDAPQTVNKVSSTRFTLDQSKGASFFIERAWLSIPLKDAVATTDGFGVQISTKSNAEASALYGIDSENEVITEYFYDVFTTDLIRNGKDAKVEIELPNFSGIMVGKEFYLNHLVLGQDGAIGCVLKFKGNYSGKVLDPDYHNKNL